jgi:very-short-patch-repair endonuclease
VYADGPEPVTQLDRERATVLARNTSARGALAGVLHGLDSVRLDGRPTRRTDLVARDIVTLGDIACADGRQTLVDLSATLDDDVWEQALESALRKRLVTLDDLVATGRHPGAARINRVLERRGDVPPTESLLETLFVQLARTVEGVADPVRQHVITTTEAGVFVARVDLCWPEIGLFVELDGRQHAGQPVYDARRETAVVAATGWLCGRFTWYEVTRIPRATAHRVGSLVEQARRRPVGV